MTSGRYSSSHMTVDSKCQSRWACSRLVRGSSQSVSCLNPRKKPHNLWWCGDTSVGHLGDTLYARVAYTGKWIFFFRLYCGVICSQWDVLSCSKTCTYLLIRYISRWTRQEHMIPAINDKPNCQREIRNQELFWCAFYNYEKEDVQ